MAAMLDREAIRLVAALADPLTRAESATALAVHFGAGALLIFVEDAEVDALLPVPGLPQTVPGGELWRTFLTQCRVSGFHHGTVAYPRLENVAAAHACAGSGVAIVFVGGECDLPSMDSMESIGLVLPLVGATLRAEHRVAVAAGEVVVARDDARHAGALARSLDSARAALERQAKSLKEATNRAEVASRAKNEFLAMLGHELRNPLAPIMTALQIMRLKGSASREHEILDRQVRHLMRLVDDLLDVSRIASGKVELRKVRVELGDVIARAVEVASHLPEQRQQMLTVNVPDHGIPVEGDADRLTQVFSNLITNAAKYSERNTKIVVSAERIADKAVVRVKDEGFGIEPDMLDAIFDRFAQQKQSMDRSMGGLGLGLAIVKNLVSLHGGTVRAISEGPGKGSDFVVELPLSSLTADAAPPTAAASSSNRALEKPRLDGMLRVLVVDDNDDAAEMLSKALQGLGYVVRTAPDGPSALVVAEEFRPQVALLDIGLPVMDGYEVGRRLRDEQGETELRLVALTGYGQASDKARSQEAGFDAHLVKPIDLAKVQRLLEDFKPAQSEG
jgi:signal transduction histidine kinase/ActR/RegA family two-component response regulator